MLSFLLFLIKGINEAVPQQLNSQWIEKYSRRDFKNSEHVFAVFFLFVQDQPR